ncbi:Gfo/Idh/MocA family protein [Rhizohabitans arisaemae]|uniref:Gfo/Idh/MocA family protein n=1 Tax=Rhizohabitans arisaemae TaxID=2720610 RepID=UPI0024B1E0C2|nr:Gfo/Idh/MocA family oxidoreductase [Rhizohabitans arisaemae]
MRTLGVLLAGSAGAGHQNHQAEMYAPGFAAHPGFRIVGATEDRSGFDRADVDVVSVCVPFEHRVEVVTAALRAGKHVLVDKPVALTSAECAQIAAVAAETGLVCLPAYHQRFHPAIRAAREAVAAGRVGLPWNVQADFLVAGGGPVWPYGELLNFAPYATDAIHAVTGLPVTAVYALARPVEGPEDLVTLCLTHERGMTSTVVAGRTPPIAGVQGLSLHRYRISGSHGTLLADATRPGVTVRGEKGTRTAWAGHGTVHRMLTELHAAVTGGRPAELGPADALAALLLVEAAGESVATGRVVRLDNEQARVS